MRDRAIAGMHVFTHGMFQDGRAREAAEWYVSVGPGSRVERVVDNGAGAAAAQTLASTPGH